MKVADCDCTQADFVAWYKYKVSFEEKTVRFLVLVILAGAFVSLFGSMANDFVLLGASILIVALGAGAWCAYNAVRLSKEIQRFSREKEGDRCVVEFVKHGIQVNRDGQRSYYPFDRIQKAREIPWYLFLFLGDGKDPIIIDKRKIRTVADGLEPYYIAKKLREQSPDYRYVKGNDLTFTGKYSKLVNG